MNVSELRKKNITVIGAARSGAAVATLLQRQGAKLFVSDSGKGEKVRPYLSQLSTAGIEFELGAHTEKVFNCSLMVISPGVPSTAPIVVEAQKRGIKVLSELEVASWFCPSPVIAITGSNGKTTTTTLVGRILSDAKKKHVVAGNIGTAFSAVVLELDQTTLAVLEVSSFQLDHCETFRPWISVILNITPDHMDRYGNSMERYTASKSRIFMNQTPGDIFIYNADDEWTTKGARAVTARKIGFSLRQTMSEGAFTEQNKLMTSLGGKRTAIIAANEISIPGMHNLSNAMAATLVGLLCGVGPASVRATLRNFKGVEHRLEFVRTVNGVRYINDSKATNVESVWYALQSFEEPIVLLLGGRDKGNDYSKLHELVKNRVRAIVAMGESAEKIVAVFGSRKKTVKASSMDEAVQAAQSLASQGDVVLLSPACASFDWFENYEQRGAVFKDLVQQL